MPIFEATRDYSIKTEASRYKMPSMHYHDSYELYYLEAGSREYFVEDRLFSVAAGEFVLIPPGKLHRTGGEYGLRTLVIFTRRFLERSYTKETVERILTCFTHVKLVPGEEQQATCRYLLKRLAAARDDIQFALVLGLLLEELTRCGSPEIRDDSVSGIVEFINHNFADINSISQVAERFYISKYHLCRVFKNAMKVTVIEYLNQIRIKNARHLLESSSYDISHISGLCGFNSVAYFSNVFHKLVGCSPSEYRKGR